MTYQYGAKLFCGLSATRARVILYSFNIAKYLPKCRLLLSLNMSLN